MKINLNDIISFKLTEYGKEKLLKHKNRYVKYGVKRTYRVNKNQTMQLWCFIQAFGNEMFLGNKPLVENNNIFLGEINE